MTNRLPRKNAVSIGEVLKEMFKHSRIDSKLNTQLVYSAWNKVSGAEQYTIKRFFRDGKLYITLNSSVVRCQLDFQKKFLLEKLNETLRAEGLFSSDDESSAPVKELILK